MLQRLLVQLVMLVVMRICIGSKSRQPGKRELGHMHRYDQPRLYICIGMRCYICCQLFNLYVLGLIYDAYVVSTHSV